MNLNVIGQTYIHVFYYDPLGGRKTNSEDMERSNATVQLDPDESLFNMKVFVFRKRDKTLKVRT